MHLVFTGKKKKKERVGEETENVGQIMSTK